MATDFRALCAEMAAELDHNRRCLLDDATLTHPLADRARAALAEPVAERVTRALPEHAPDEHPPSSLDRREVAAWSHGPGCGWQAARAALAEQVTEPPAPPAEGEIDQLVSQLRDYAQGEAENGWHDDAARFRRAAELLERHAAPVPVPVAERLPGPKDCDAEGRCWLCGKVEGDWRLINPANAGVPRLQYYFSHWLPAHALPLPAPQGGEVEP